MAAASCRVLRRAGLTGDRASRQPAASNAAVLSLAALLGLALLGTPAAADTFSITAPGGAIPDNDVFVGTLTFSPELFELRNLELEIAGLTHTRPADLRIYLADPFGTTIEVMRYFGGNSAVLVNLTFSDSRTSVPSTFAFVSGAYRPYGQFEGSDNGLATWHCADSGSDPWVLLIIDQVPGNTGWFSSFTIRGAHSACGPTLESTGFEPVEGFGGWERGWICGSTFTNCTGPPIAQSCTGDPLVDGDCCINNPNPLNGWYVSGTNQHCNQPHISTENPVSGSQHLRLAQDPAGGNPPGCTGYGTACRINAFTPTAGPEIPFGRVSVEMDVAMSYDIWNQWGDLVYFTVDDSEPGATSLYFYWLYYGLWFVYDYAGPSFAFVGYLYGEDDYSRYRADIDPCDPQSIKYYVDYGAGYELTHSTSVLGAAMRISRGVFAFNNIPPAGHFDVDNYTVTRGPPCAQECGNGFVEPPEQCEPGVAGPCPAGRCIAPGEPNECSCRRICTAAQPCTLHNGDNGPFVAPFDAAYGGVWHYEGGSPAVEFDTCGSTGLNAPIRVFDSTTRVAQNTNCCDPAHPSCGNYGNGSTPNAACYNPAGLSTQACTCAVNANPYGLDLQVHPVASDGASVMIHIGKKAECGGALLGSCCDITPFSGGVCIDDVPADQCTGPYQTFAEEPCKDLECNEPVGACCNRSPGAGGACLDGVIYQECEGKYLAWFEGGSCGTLGLDCAEVTGACCDHLAGDCAPNTVLNCTCPDCDWFEGLSCSTIPCTPIAGACCERGIDFAQCSQTSLAQCDAIGGEWTRETDCIFVACEPSFSTIPAVSQWGLVVLTLLLLIGGKLWIARPERRAPHAPTV